MRHDKADRITIRFPPLIGRKIRALAKAQGMSVADYCRAKCMVDIVNDEPHPSFTVAQQQFKETMADMETFAQLDPKDQADVLRRSLEAVATVKKSADKAFTWLYALATASDALTNQKGGPQDARAGDEGGTRPADDD
jgi:hypothetical protein